ncbi:flagellar motor protein MotB [Kineococcus gynurae]|uniref:Flagellar motor protein MotB n=1 Tax=Kineococcus gynurae TaxID=452979 RepID=A0ABV5LR43_9ACTN
MSGGGHKRRGKHEEHEEHVNHERWLVSYADMLTVLVALFIVLFALSQIDQVKFAQFKAGLTDGASASNLVMPGNDGINNVDNGQDPIDLLPQAGGDPMQAMSAADSERRIMGNIAKAQSQADLKAAKEQVEDYRGVIQQIDAALTPSGSQDQVTYRITSDGLVVGLVADNVFFANASAGVEPRGRAVLDAIAPVLAKLPNDIAVQGHTNSLPLKDTSRFADNWSLSSERANNVLRLFLADGFSPARLSAQGFADTRPLYPADDPRALNGNRRVDLIVASPGTDAVKSLLPQVAQDTPGAVEQEIATPADEAAGDTAAVETGGSVSVAGPDPVVIGTTNALPTGSTDGQ